MVAKKNLNDHLLLNDDDRDKDDVLIYDNEMPEQNELNVLNDINNENL